MGKTKNGYNWKARQVVEVTTDNSHKKKISVQLDSVSQSKYDDANPLVLPSKKRHSTVKKKNLPIVKLLSKKQRKLYEKVVEKRQKKEKRAALAEALCSVQANSDILDQLTSITEIQTKGRKRIFDGEIDANTDTDSAWIKKLKLGATRKKRKQRNDNHIEVNDPNVVGFITSDSESESEDEAVEPNQPELSVDNTSQLHENNTIEIDTVDDIRTDSEPQNEESSKLQDESEDVKNKSVIPVVKETREVGEKKIFVPVDRDAEIQRLRLNLPIIGEEQVIMEAINDNDVVIIAGETGSGKTTQLPQFLYEAGYTQNGKLIGITEPRRVAAISMSHRVAKELNVTRDVVSYLIRFEGNTTPKTQIKFMTDGVLLKEIQKDFMLSKYSVVILDEAHERSVFTDILIGLLSRIALWRKKRDMPLKVVIMSATLRLTDFTCNQKLFKITPPVIKVDARQYPVSVHFNKRTSVDYMKETFRKACKIHTQLPEGGILIFLTGQQEVNKLVTKLRRTFPIANRDNKATTKVKHELVEGGEGNEEALNPEEDADSDEEMSGKQLRHKLRNARKNVLPEINLEDYATKPTEDEMELYETDDEDMDTNLEFEQLASNNKVQPMWVLPLYSLLPSNKQARVFEPPPEGCRLCVVATNVAETSLTIPHVKYVIDSGRTKTRMYDKLTSVSTFTVVWTSKASADQRAGRAGRTAAGHCYRLYSSAVYNDEFENWSVPEMQRKPVDDLLLQMKAMGIDKVVNFPFPSPPDLVQLKSAERRLTLLGALKPNFNGKDEWETKLTPLGESMAVFPVAPRFSKMLCLSQQHNLLPYTIAIVAALSVQEFLLASNDGFSRIWRTWAGVGNSLLLGDVMVLLRALGAAEHAGTTEEGVEKFCQRCGLRYKAVVEARKLRVQLTNELNLNVPDLDLVVDPKIVPPNDTQARQLRQIIMAGMVDQVAYKLSADELKEAGLSVHKAAYRIPELQDIIFLNASSVLRKVKPEWVVYQEVYQHNEKLHARGVTAIEPEWLPLYAPSLCNISEPLKDPAPYYEESSGRVMCSVSSTFGRSGWQLPVVQIEHPVNEDKFKWFALFFLEGLVCPKMAEYAQHLLSPPCTLFKSWSKFLMSRTNVVLKVLMEKEVHSKDRLLEQWQRNPKYMLDAYLEWLPQAAHGEVKELWPLL